MKKNQIAYACFTDEMLNVLREMKGKTFKSYEYDATDKFDHATFRLRLNLGTFAIDLSNELHMLPLWGRDEPDAIVDEIAYFKCEKAKLSDPFPYGIETKAYMVDERIKAVRVIRNEIYIEKFDFTVIMDYALIIETRWHTYAFSREVSFGDDITIAMDSIAKVFTNEQVIADWSDDESAPDYDGEPGEGWIAATTRQIIEL